MYFISNDLMRFNMPIMVSRKGRALFQNWLVLYKNLKHFTCPVCFCFLISIRGDLKWVKAPLTYTTFCVMCACLGLPTCNCKIIYHHHISCKLLTVSNVLLHTQVTQDLSGITWRSPNRVTTEFLIWALLGFSMIHDQKAFQVHARRAAVSSVSEKKCWTFQTSIRIFRILTAF